MSETNVYFLPNDAPPDAVEAMLNGGGTAADPYVPQSVTDALEAEIATNAAAITAETNRATARENAIEDGYQAGDASFQADLTRIERLQAVRSGAWLAELLQKVGGFTITSATGNGVNITVNVDSTARIQSGTRVELKDVGVLSGRYELQAITLVNGTSFTIPASITQATITPTNGTGGTIGFTVDDPDRVIDGLIEVEGVIGGVADVHMATTVTKSGDTLFIEDCPLPGFAAAVGSRVTAGSAAWGVAKGNYTTPAVRLNDLFAIGNHTRLNAATLAGATSATVKDAPYAGMSGRGWALFDPFDASLAEMKRAAISGSTVSWTGGLASAHAANAPVLFLPDNRTPVTWFGTDLSGATSSTAAVQRAANQGGETHFPDGEYLFASQVNLIEGARVTGNGKRSKLRSVANDQILRADGLSFVKLSDLYLVGVNDVGETAGTGEENIGVYLSNCEFVILESLWARGFGKHGVAIVGGGTDAVNNRRVMASKVFAYQNRATGVFIIRGNSYLSLSHIHAFQNGAQGMAIDDSSTADTGTLIDQNEHGTLSNILAYDNTDCGLLLEGAYGFALSAVAAVRNGLTSYFGQPQSGDGIKVNNTQNQIPSVFNTFAACVTNYNRRHGIALLGSSYNQVSAHQSNNNSNGATGGYNALIQSVDYSGTKVGASHNHLQGSFCKTDGGTVGTFGIVVGSNSTLGIDCIGNHVVDSNAFDTTGGTWAGVYDEGTGTIRRGNKLLASSPIVGTATLNGTTNVVVAAAAVTSRTRIRVERRTISGTAGNIHIVGISAGTSFTIVSDQATDVGTVYWELVH